MRQLCHASSKLMLMSSSPGYCLDSGDRGLTVLNGLRWIMGWQRDRDALIAQTIAFVQSVTGRKEETGRPNAALPSPAPPQISVQQKLDVDSPSQKPIPLFESYKPAEPPQILAAAPAACRIKRHAERNTRPDRELPRASGALQPRTRGIFQRDAGKA